MALVKAVQEKVDRPLSVKLEETRAIITNNLDQFGSEVVVAFSGGKDSLLVLHLIREHYPGVTVAFSNTGVEYPETRAFVSQIAEEWALNLVTLHPYKKNFWQCVKEYGFSGKKGKAHSPHSRCCYYLKEMPMKLAIKKNGWLAIFTGQTASESRVRMFVARDKGTCYFARDYGAYKINPILWWTEQEVWDFTNQEGLPHNPLYDMGAHRVGCMPCTAYLNWEEEMSKLNLDMYALIKLRKDGQYTMKEILASTGTRHD